nr:hypothetical protein [Novosphingobium marinum]
MQRQVIAGGRKLLITLEGRDAAGKDGTIKRIVKHLSPRLKAIELRGHHQGAAMAIQTPGGAHATNGDEKMASPPSWCSISSKRLYLARRSPRHGAPPLN